MINVGVYGFWRCSLSIKNRYISVLFPGQDINIVDDITKYNSNDINIIGDWFNYKKDELLKYGSCNKVPVIRLSFESNLVKRSRYSSANIVLELDAPYKICAGYFNNSYNVDRIIYYPLWLSFARDFDTLIKMPDNFEERYDNYICDLTRNKMVTFREQFYQSIGSNRISTKNKCYSDSDRANKINLISNYLFNACFENCFELGYITEKSVEASLAGCLPIYNGVFDNRYPFPFNKDRMFIFTREEIKQVDKNLFRNMDKQYLKDKFELPIFVDNYKDILAELHESLRIKL